MGQNWAYISLYRQRFWSYRSIFKISVFGHGTWSLAFFLFFELNVCPYVNWLGSLIAIIRKINRVLVLTGLYYHAKFENATAVCFGDIVFTFQVTEKLKTLHIHSTQGSRKWLYFSILCSLSEIWAYCQNCHIWTWNLTTGKSSRSCTYILSTPGGRNVAYFRSTGNGFWDTGHDFF